jgi:hypothetical protein
MKRSLFRRNSAFHNAREIAAYRVVSNLQLYLDLYNFLPRGREHADYLKNVLQGRGEAI